MASVRSSRVLLHRLSLAVPLALLALLVTPQPALAVGDYIGFEPAPWAQSLDARAAIDGDVLAGTTVDFEDTLGLDPDDTSAMGRLWFRWFKKNRLILDLADTSRSGSEVLSQDLTFNDTAYGTGETVASAFDMRLLQAKYRYEFVDLKVVSVGAGVGLNLAEVDMRLDGSAAGLTTLQENVPFPTLNAGVVFKPLPGFHIRAEADGLSLTVSGNEVDILDARLQLEYYFMHFFGAFVGYRSYQFNVDADDFGLVDATFDGPYFGLGIKF